MTAEPGLSGNYTDSPGRYRLSPCATYSDVAEAGVPPPLWPASP
jgi:hypothetical protein